LCYNPPQYGRNETARDHNKFLVVYGSKCNGHNVKNNDVMLVTMITFNGIAVGARPASLACHTIHWSTIIASEGYVFA